MGFELHPPYSGVTFLKFDYLIVDPMLGDSFSSSEVALLASQVRELESKLESARARAAEAEDERRRTKEMLEHVNQSKTFIIIKVI